MELGCGIYEDLCVGFGGRLVVKGMMESMFYESVFFGNICIVLDFDFLSFWVAWIDSYDDTGLAF